MPLWRYCGVGIVCLVLCIVCMVNTTAALSAPPIKWERTFTNGEVNVPYVFLEDSASNGYAIVGNTDTQGFLIQTNAGGVAKRWTYFRKLEGHIIPFIPGYSVQQTTDAYSLIGLSGSSVYQITVDKTTGTASEKLVVQLDEGITGRYVEQTADGGIIVTGIIMMYDEDEGEDCAFIYLAKYGNDGTKTWDKTYNDYCCWITPRIVHQTSDNGYVVLSDLYVLGNIAVLLKTDADGNEQWLANYGSMRQTRGMAIEELSDGGFILSGEGTMTTGYMFLAGYDSNGNLLWDERYGTIEHGLQGGYGVRQLSDGGYFLTGQILQLEEFDYQAYVIRTDSLGIEIWETEFGSSDSMAYFAQPLKNGFAVVGTTPGTVADSQDIFLVAFEKEII